MTNAKSLKPNWHPAKRALVGFARQIQNMPFTGFFGKQGSTRFVLSFDLLVCANAGVKPQCGVEQLVVQ